MKAYLKIIFLIIIPVLIFSACKKNYPNAPDTINEQKLLDLVNDVRSTGCDCGDTYFPPVNDLVWNDDLEAVALIHSKDMDKHNDLDHTGSDGSSAGDRLNDFGYSWSAYGENIALGYSTEDAVIKGWLESTGHCENIMDGDYTEMGVAASGAYWTQLFARPNK